MGIKICCTYNDQGAWCTNLNIERSLFGIGTRRCMEFPYDNNSCKYKKLIPKPSAPPPPPRPKNKT